MATFVKGNFVKVQPGVDWKWDQWSINHTNLCDKICTVVDVKYESWVNQLFVEVESKSGERVWFLDHHLIIVSNYEEIYFESIRRSCEQLQRHESICKKLRDEILNGVFNPYLDEETETEAKDLDDIFNDWQEVTTKEVIPLPGNGGTMTAVSDPKVAANSNRNKVRKIKSLGKKITKKGKQKISGSLSSSWTLTDEELKELEDYIDALPENSTTTTSSDVDINYGSDDDWEWGDGSAD